MNKKMSPEEFAEWASRHTAQEVQERAIELQDQLVTDLASTAGVDREQFERLGTDAKEMVATAGAEQWLDENEAQQEPEPVGTTQFDFGNSEGIEIELPANSKIAKMIDRGLVRMPLADDSEEAQMIAQATFAATHPYTKSVTNGNLLRDRVEKNGGTYFTAENLDQAFRELVFEGQIEIGYEFYQS